MKIRQNISQRTHADITIYRVGQSNVSVPITARSIRRYMLMQEDFVQLEFSLPQPIHIAIGDYIIDELFGHFVVTTEQMPKYNSRTGGYDYSLRFDAEYYGWHNWLMCLAIDGKRMESRWNLTDRLDTHVQQVADNINIITNATKTGHTDTQTGITTYTSNGYGIEVTVDNASEIKHLAYEGTDIISAMTAISEAWSCEWWVTSDSVTNGNTTYAKTIHFGKCEDSGEPYEMMLGGNVETMDVTRDQQEYCNRLFAYGGTRNIPEDYDRHLEFTASASSWGTTFYDPNKELTVDMIDGVPTIPTVSFTFGSWSQSGTNAERTYTQETIHQSLMGKQTINIDLSSMFGISSVDFIALDLPTVSLAITLHYGTVTRLLRIRGFRQGEIIDGIGWFGDLTTSNVIDLGTTAVDVFLRLVWTVTFPNSRHTNDDVLHDTTGTMQAVSASANKPVTVVFNGNTYNCTFEGSTGRISPKPSGMSNGSKYTITNLNLPKIPLSWFTVDYDAGALAMAGEKRLHLPSDDYPNRYIETATRSASQIVERAIIFDALYPKMSLRIKEDTLQGEEKQQRIDHSDGSVSYEDWTQWSFEVETTDGAPFNFRDYYILDGNKLQAVFQAPTNINATGHLLAGMTFDVGFSGSRYTIIRNDDYGVLLPNSRLVPNEGDTLILTGWNPRYINDLDMVSAAENELATKANEYLQAIQEGQFTINNKMMSDSMTDEPFTDEQGKFGLLEAGSKVKVYHDAMPNGYKESRVLGYEYKLDMPFDTPTYIIGETDAYSRLKQLEKQITKLS